jgi:hypothetical protein
MQAVRADDPLDVPHVRRALERLDAILGEISSA